MSKSFEQFFREYFGCYPASDDCLPPHNRKGRPVEIGDLRTIWEAAQKAERAKDFIDLDD